MSFNNAKPSNLTKINRTKLYLNGFLFEHGDWSMQLQGIVIITVGFCAVQLGAAFPSTSQRPRILVAVNYACFAADTGNVSAFRFIIF